MARRWSAIDAHGDVALLVLAVTFAGHGGYALDRRLEHVGIVIRFFALQDHAQTLEAHTRIHMLGGQRLQLAARLAVELHEHEVPNLDHQMMARVDHVTARDRGDIGLVTQIEVDLAARTAGTRLAHLPEVVVLVAADDVVLGQKRFQ